MAINVGFFTTKARGKIISGKTETARGVIGFTGNEERGSGDIYSPINKSGEIDLTTLGHEVFYHIMNDYKH